MSEVKRFNLTCIICPLGCNIEVVVEGDKIISVKGCTCPRGEEYAVQEILSPKRTVMSVVKVRNGIFPTVSVKSDKPVPKEMIPQIMRELSKIEVDAPIRPGQIIVKNILNTGADIVATRAA